MQAPRGEGVSHLDAAPADLDDDAGIAERFTRCRKPGSVIGEWTVQGVLGEGRQGAIVYHAVRKSLDEDSLKPTEAALKFPVRDGEIECLWRVRSVPGVPTLFDSGRDSSGSFLAMPVLSASLEALLHQLDHDGLGGRLSWEAVSSLGCMLVQTLEGIHANGVVHCDLKPGNILLPKSGSRPHIIDFGRSHLLDMLLLNDGVAGGALEYNSIRAGRGESCLTPISDLECLGWILLRCVLGHLPWRKSILEFKKANAPRDVFAKLISEAKERYLNSGCRHEGWRYKYCAHQLREYLGYINSSRNSLKAEPQYQRLIALLRTDSADWGHVVDRFLRMSPAFEPGVVSAVQGELVWRDSGGLIYTDAVPKDIRIRVTGCEEVDDVGRWLEVDAVWSPGLPLKLLEKSWLLVASDGGGALVDFVSIREKPTAPRDPFEDAEFFLVGSWDEWTDFVPLMPLHNEFEPNRPYKFHASVFINDDVSSVEFQVVQDRDWKRRFCPLVLDKDKIEIIGPVKAHGRNWEAPIPPGNEQHLCVIWNPCGRRTLKAGVTKNPSQALPEMSNIELCNYTQFFLVGSWDDWKDFVKLLPECGTEPHQFRATVPVQANVSSIEFQVVQDRDWTRRFYPSFVGEPDRVEILGPLDTHGQNWKVSIPLGGGRLSVTWQPAAGMRALSAYFSRNLDSNVATQILHAQPCDKREFFLIGSWDDWKELVQFVPERHQLPRHFHVSVPVWTHISLVDFQVIQDRDWKQRFYPSIDPDSGGEEILGPSETCGQNWMLSKPLGKLRHLCVTWNPYGNRSLSASFLKLPLGRMRQKDCTTKVAE